MRSPVDPLLPSIASSLSALVPEKHAELVEMLQRLNIGIDPHFDRSVSPLHIHHDGKVHTIRIYVPLLERFWACSYGYSQLLNTLGPILPGEHDLIADPKLENARRLLSWAYFGGEGDWPDGLPRPTATPTGDAAVFEATEAFLCMVGWMLFHEVGHAELGHGDRSARDYDESEQREFEADDFASKWILDKWQEYSPDELVFIKRSLGGVLALSILTTYEVHKRTRGGLTHPDPIERLRRYLKKYCPEGTGEEPTETDYAWTAAIVIVKLHLDNARRVMPNGPFANFEDVMNAAEQALG